MDIFRLATRRLSRAGQYVPEADRLHYEIPEHLHQARRCCDHDRHLRELVSGGALKRLAQGLYYAPKKSAFGVLPPDDQELVTAFLRDKDFLVFSRSSYNALGLGTSQLYNKTLVYNRKRHGLFSFGNREFDFRVKPRFPKKLSPEFLLVDAVNHLDELAEDQNRVLEMVARKLPGFDQAKLKRAVADFGSVATQKRFMRWLAEFSFR